MLEPRHDGVAARGLDRGHELFDEGVVLGGRPRYEKDGVSEAAHEAVTRLYPDM